MSREGEMLKNVNHAESAYLLVSHLVADFDYIRGDTIFKDFDSLRSLYRESRCKQAVA